MSPRYEGHVSNRIETVVDRKGVEMRRNANFRAQRHSDRIIGYIFDPPSPWNDSQQGESD